MADVGRSASKAAQVIPGCAVVHLAEPELIQLLESETDEVVRGVFQIFMRLGRRPNALWPNEHDEAASPAERWGAALRRLGVALIAETYLATFATPLDLPLLDAIVAAEVSEDISQLRDLIGGNPLVMASAVSSRAYQPEWKTVVLTSAMSAVDVDVLEVLAIGKSTPSTLRAAAAMELRSRGEITDEILSRLMTFPSVIDDIFQWSAGDGSGVTLEQLARVIAQLDRDTPGFSDLETRIQAATASTEELVARLDSTAGALQAWDALEWKEDATLSDRAREIFDQDADPLVARLLDHPGWRDHLDIIPYVRSKCRLVALRILMRQNPIPDDDRARVRMEVERRSEYTKQQSCRWLSQVATSEDLTILLSMLPELYGDTTIDVVENIVHVGGRDAAKRILEVGNGDQQAIAVRALGRDPTTDLFEIQELLYSSISEVRMAAVEQIIERLDRDQLSALLDTYPDAGRYFYNVVCEIDWVLFASADSSSTAA